MGGDGEVFAGAGEVDGVDGMGGSLAYLIYIGWSRTAPRPPGLFLVEKKEKKPSQKPPSIHNQLHAQKLILRKTYTKTAPSPPSPPRTLSIKTQPINPSPINHPTPRTLRPKTPASVEVPRKSRPAQPSATKTNTHARGTRLDYIHHHTSGPNDGRTRGSRVE